ncbi:CRISPR-associated helicase Cas3' [Streptomyces sp. NBC_01803]|uniref:CRISPR-associated helicase Cas3' n=1 Tax=Streptomyces sp. NBC_01803 TaxID=2975946 RepID=UPI002DD85034|nr:CRISPR-associated helicase Cas3' [Streptomyces sp. NBC_01803]WSA44219.1 CRISPR-associated helicase Cas3' [Streptomyces sp. NBC_01803]
MTAPPLPPPELSQLRAKSPQGDQTVGDGLTEHLLDTLLASLAVRRRVGYLEPAETVMGGQFWSAVGWAALAHDTGKIVGGFQAMVRGRTRAWGERHEVASLGFLPWLIEDTTLSVWVATAVATHHRALTGQNLRDLETLYGGSDAAELHDRFTPIPEPAVAAMAGWLREAAAAHALPAAPQQPAGNMTAAGLLHQAHTLLQTLLDRWNEPVGPREGVAAVLLQGAVTMSDHLSSAHARLAVAQPLNAGFPALLEKHLAGRHSTLRAHQAQAGDRVGDLLLRAPTGSGKTEAGLLWAARQVADLAAVTGGTPRVFYTLPYLSSINAMASRLRELLGGPDTIGVAHSRAASYHLATATAAQDGDEDSTSRASAAAKAVSRAAATRLFHETVRVGTPYQLLRAALAGPAHSGTLLDAANSVFVLDELHAYDPRRLGYILASARLWKDLGGRIAVLSATLPDSLAGLFRHALRENIPLLEPPGPRPPTRHRLAVRHHHLTDPAALAEVRRRLDRDESVLIVANNIAHALALFEELHPLVADRHGEHAALLLHSRFRRGDRLDIEKAITDRFGAGAARRPGLLIATQVVEVSLDVDFDVLFTAAAPLEALLQRFGRVNRTAARPPADVIVHQPAWTARRSRPGEQYADGIYEREPVQSAWEILTRHDTALIDETDATSWLNTIYGTDWGKRWHGHVMEHLDAFHNAFLRFEHPFDDREDLSETFDELFDGTEAVLLEDKDAYAQALTEAKGAAGRLLADDLLIPMPYWAASLTRWEKQLKVRVIDGNYNPRLGLLSVRGTPARTYQPGEVL